MVWSERERDFAHPFDNALMGFGEMPVFRQFEPAPHVPEAILVGDKLDEPFAAVGVQFEDLLSGDRRGFRPDSRVIAIGEGVFGIQLELVDLEAGEPIDQIKQRFHRRNFIAADIEHDAARREIGIVFDSEQWQFRAVRLEKLGEGLRAIECTSGVIGGDSDAILGDR